MARNLPKPVRHYAETFEGWSVDLVDFESELVLTVYGKTKDHVVRRAQRTLNSLAPDPFLPVLQFRKEE